jgi:hypothetical protein
VPQCYLFSTGRWRPAVASRNIWGERQWLQQKTSYPHDKVE